MEVCRARPSDSPSVHAALGQRPGDRRGRDRGRPAPSIQLLHYELGERKGQSAVRFVAYDEEGHLEQRPLIVNEREIAALRGEIARSPRLRALLKRLVED
ncbi:MAG: hypothetical protein O2822_02605 [Chloroflexi bacterium]|nr:hypothetical protein [Chloroflexota bacterium]